MPELRKVVHVMRRLIPEVWGGTENVVLNVSRAFIRQGIESPVHCTAMCSRPGDAVVGGVPIKRHGYVFPWLGLSADARRALQLKGGSPLSLSLFAGLLKEKNTSIIHAHVQHRLGGMARTAARLKGIPFVVSLHGGYFTLPQEQIDGMKRPFAGRLEWGKVFGALFGARRVLEDADGVICVGRSEFEEVQRRFPDKPVFLVPNGVDVSTFSNADGAAFRKAYGFDEADRIILCVSRIDPQKNQSGLVRAFARFAVEHPLHRLVLMGPVAVEAYQREVEAEINRLDLRGSVTLAGGLPPDNPLLASAYKAAEMFVLPSVHEPFGMVVLEAWAAGTPVVASRVGGLAGFATDRETAWLVEPADETELADAMAELAGDDALRSALADRAFRAVEAEYDWPVVAGRLRAIYEQLIRAKQ